MDVFSKCVFVYDYCVCIPFCGYETQITVKLQNNMHIFKHIIHIYPELFTPMMARPVVVFLEGERGREGVERAFNSSWGCEDKTRH